MNKLEQLALMQDLMKVYNHLGMCTFLGLHFKNVKSDKPFFFFSIFLKSEMSSTHCFLRIENQSISHGVVIIALNF